MRRLLPVLILTLATLAPAAAPSAAPAAERRCKGMVVDGNRISRLRAVGVGCLTARRVARAWVRSEDCNALIGNPEDCTVRRYRCTMADSGFGTAVTCRRPSRRVRFRVDAA